VGPGVEELLVLFRIDDIIRGGDHPFKTADNLGVVTYSGKRQDLGQLRTSLCWGVRHRIALPKDLLKSDAVVKRKSFNHRDYGG
jgi:hypothetical protein